MSHGLPLAAGAARVAYGTYHAYKKEGAPAAVTEATIGTTAVAEGMLAGAAFGLPGILVGGAIGFVVEIYAPEYVNKLTNLASTSLVDEESEYPRQQPISLINDYQRRGEVMPLAIRQKVLDGLLKQDISWPTVKGVPLGFGYSIPR